MEFSETAKNWLLERCRTAIAEAIHGRDLQAPESVPKQVECPLACFVTLSGGGGELRGCIGTFASDAPLWKTAERMARAAAMEDPRFAPMTDARELAHCSLEISVLSEPETIDAEDLTVGVHGLVISSGARRGVLLPQVAVEQRWDRETFLAQTCRKAGLAPTAWRAASTTLEAFTATVIKEGQNGSA